MSHIMPQEVEVWYLLPSVRKHLAVIFTKELDLKQKQAAEILGITEAAVSQYIKAKRGKEVKFTKEDIEKIRKTANKILEDRTNVVKHIYDLCASFRGTETLCRTHRRYDRTVGKDCDICARYSKAKITK